jgi:Heavy metal binding domain
MPLKRIPLLILVVTAVLSARLPQAPWHAHAAQQDLPPLSYVCPMPADAEVLEDKPGKCPICSMDLIPVRIDTAWSCPNHAAVIRDKAGVCPIDKRELVQVIVAKHWSCADQPDVYLGDPGKCGDGSARKLVTELRAHGDHNPRHGGQFFMAADKWHHLEGTYPSPGLVRLYFYDNFTKPLVPKGMTGRVIVEDNGKEIASFPLTAARNGQTLEAHVKGAQLPMAVAAKVQFDAKTTEQRFDFTFDKLSIDAPVAPVTTSNGATTGAPPAAGAGAPRAAAAVPAKPAVAPKAPATGTPAAALPAPAAVPDTAAAGVAGITQTANAATMSRTDAAVLADNLPSAPADLLKMLEQRTHEVDQAIQEGQFGYVYIPTMLSKDIALALDDHVKDLPEQKRLQASSAIRRLVLASWELDLYGDLGNKEKITNVYNLFAAAFADIKAAYGAR